MKINETMQHALNEQLNHELQSAYLYLAMAAWLDKTNLPGAAHWMRVQAQEEQAHALKIYHYLYDRLGEVRLMALQAPQASWESPLEVFRSTLQHEQVVTQHIHRLAEQAMQERDLATVEFLHWFVREQVEEESTADRLVHQLELIGDSKGGLFMFDHELAKRGAEG